MPKFGFHASHEQFSPIELLEWAKLAETFNFDYILSSDHISPWKEISTPNCAFSWTWLASALQATSLHFGSVSVPGYRYHPVVLAQAISTLCYMYPGRFDVCLGSGEALNEHMIGKKWPDKEKRNQMLYESVQVMKRLWKGETVTQRGTIDTNQARLHILPPEMPKIFGAALTVETAAWVASWADGFVTIADNKLQERVAAFKKNGGQEKPMILKMDLSYANNYDNALQSAFEEWRYLILPSEKLATLKTPQEIEKESEKITKEMVSEKIAIFTKPKDALDWIKPFLEMGFEKIVFHNVNKNQKQFIEDFGEDVLTHL